VTSFSVIAADVFAGAVTVGFVSDTGDAPPNVLVAGFASEPAAGLGLKVFDIAIFLSIMKFCSMQPLHLIL
jgi:hypothetical protein